VDVVKGAHGRRMLGFSSVLMTFHAD